MDVTQAPARFRVSVKGVVLDATARVLLLKNDRDHWELPGGGLEPGENPRDCVIREIAEETGLVATCERILDSWLHVAPKGEVVIVTYGCTVPPATAALASVSTEHVELGWFSTSELDAVVMPDGFRASILRWLEASQQPAY